MSSGTPVYEDFPFVHVAPGVPHAEVVAACESFLGDGVTVWNFCFHDGYAWTVVLDEYPTPQGRPEVVAAKLSEILGVKVITDREQDAIVTAADSAA